MQKVKLDFNEDDDLWDATSSENEHGNSYSVKPTSETVSKNNGTFTDGDFEFSPTVSTRLRSSRALNRGNRGAPDHDIMEGLPVRQWRKQNLVVSTKAPKEEAPVNDDPNNRWRELPMPRGSEMYSPMSQALLRAARRGRISQQQTNQGGEDKDLEEEEKKAPEPDVGIATTKWAQIAKDQERPELEFLAKRRKGLPSLHSDPVTAQPMKMVKVKKIDAEGNAAIFDVLAPEGAVVEGEIVKDEEAPTEAPAPGTVVEGVGVANEEGIVIAALEPVVPTPPRRPPPRPKRKAKGPGRGRKKKKETHTPSATTGTEAGAPADGTSNDVRPNGDTLKVPDASGDAASGTDVEMGENSPAREGEDGSDDDDDDEGDASDMDAPTRSVSPMKMPEIPAQPVDSAAALNPSGETAEGGSDVAMTETGAQGTLAESTVPTVDEAMDAEPTRIDEAPAVEGSSDIVPGASTESASEAISATAPILPQDPLHAPMEDVRTSAPPPEIAATEPAAAPIRDLLEPVVEPTPAIPEPPVPQADVVEQPPIVSEQSEATAQAPDAPLPGLDQIMDGSIPPPPPQPAEANAAPPILPGAVAEPPIDIGVADPLPPPMPIEPVIEDASAPEPPPISDESLPAGASVGEPPADASAEAKGSEPSEAPPETNAEPAKE